MSPKIPEDVSHVSLRGPFWRANYLQAFFAQHSFSLEFGEVTRKNVCGVGRWRVRGGGEVLEVLCHLGLPWLLLYHVHRLHPAQGRGQHQQSLLSCQQMKKGVTQVVFSYVAQMI